MKFTKPKRNGHTQKNMKQFTVTMCIRNDKQLEQKQITPPFRPRLDSDRDLANFPPEFTDEPVQLTVDEE